MKIQSLLKILSVDWSSLSGGNMMIIDGESGDEMEDMDGSLEEDHGTSCGRRSRPWK